MAATSTRAPAGRAANDSSDYAEFSLKTNRVALIHHFNQVAGPPSFAMAVVQDEFIGDRMSSNEKTAFVKICRGLIAAAIVSGQFPV